MNEERGGCTRKVPFRIRRRQFSRFHHTWKPQILMYSEQNTRTLSCLHHVWSILNGVYHASLLSWFIAIIWKIRVDDTFSFFWVSLWCHVLGGATSTSSLQWWFFGKNITPAKSGSFLAWLINGWPKKKHENITFWKKCQSVREMANQSATHGKQGRIARGSLPNSLSLAPDLVTTFIMMNSNGGARARGHLARCGQLPTVELTGCRVPPHLSSSHPLDRYHATIRIGNLYSIQFTVS